MEVGEGPAEGAAPVIGKVARRTAAAAQEAQKRSRCVPRCPKRRGVAPWPGHGGYDRWGLFGWPPSLEQALSGLELPRQWRPVFHPLHQKGLQRWY